MASTVIVGGGWAGIACAVELRKLRPHDTITLLEASPQLGGRARSIDWALPDETLRIDNGQHMLLGVYRDTLELIETLGVDTAKAFERHPLNLRSRFGLEFQATSHEAPWHLLLGGLRQKGLTLKDRISELRLAWYLKKNQFVLPDEMTVQQLFDLLRLTPKVAQRMLRPLCLAALNTPPALASAKVFAAILRDSVAARARDSDFLVSKLPLGELIPEPALKYLRNNYVSVELGARAQEVRSVSKGYEVVCGEKTFRGDSVVVALPLQALPALGDSFKVSGTELPYEAIATVYLYWQHQGKQNTLAGVAPHQPLMLDDLSLDCPGQWFFNLGPTPSGGMLASVVVSAITLDAAEHLRGEGLGATVAKQLRAQLGLAAPTHIRVITEKRATFRAAAGSVRAGNSALTATIPGVFLAGDYTIADYPATLESAVRSGRAAARLAAQREA